MAMRHRISRTYQRMQYKTKIMYKANRKDCILDFSTHKLGIQADSQVTIESNFQLYNEDSPNSAPCMPSR